MSILADSQGALKLMANPTTSQPGGLQALLCQSYRFATQTLHYYTAGACNLHAWAQLIQMLACSSEP